MHEQQVIVKDFSLKNNCPECYSNNGLHLVFKQSMKETSLYRSISKRISHELNCQTCNTTIFPVMWTKDIERVFEYHQKAITPKKPSITIKRKAWLWIFAIMSLLLIGLIIGLCY